MTDSEFLDDRDCEPKGHTLSLRQALALALHCMQKQRIWNGMGWTYNPLPARDYVPAMEKLREALAEAEAPAVAMTAAEQDVMHRALRRSNTKIEAEKAEPVASGARIVQTVTSCVQCPNRMYFSGGRYECTATRTQLPDPKAIPEWCPLPFYPVAHPPAALPESAETWKNLYLRAIDTANGLTNYVEERPELRRAEKELEAIQAEARAVLAAARGKG